MRTLFCLFPVALIAIFLLKPTRVADQADAKSIQDAATTFLGSLDEAQRSKALLPYEGAERTKWAFVPLETRKGIPLMEMSEAQKASALLLLRSIVSQSGFDKSRKIMDLENVLRQLEGAKSHERRNPEKYYFTLYGKPSPTGAWGLSVEGHHLSLNFVLDGGKIVDSTPQFFASNPATLRDTYGERFPKDLRVLKLEEQLAFELALSLNPEQKKIAMIADKAPAEIRWAAEIQPHQDPLRGLPVAKFDASQKQKLRELIKVYSDSMRSEVAAERWRLLEEAGFDGIHFAWAGALEPGIGHYYTIQSPTFLIEFINTQADAAGNPANHIHCVWHDMQGDFNLPIGK